MSYDVFRLIDTQYSDLVCADYLKEIEWYNPYNGISYGAVYGNITNWVDTMNVSDSGVDFAQIWDYKTYVANRTVSEDYSK